MEACAPPTIIWQVKLAAAEVSFRAGDASCSWVPIVTGPVFVAERTALAGIRKVTWN